MKSFTLIALLLAPLGRLSMKDRPLLLFPAGLFRVAALLAWAAMARAEITPSRLDQFVVAPDTAVVLQWSGAAPAASITYTVFNYAGATFASGQQSSAADGSLPLSLNLPAGYYELAFSGSTRR